MAESLPYLTSVGTIDTVFKRIRAAAKPERFTTEFVNTKLQLKGGNGATVAPFLKKLGFVNSDGTPTALYDRLRNEASAGAAVAEAMRRAYRAVFEVDVRADKLSDADLKGLVLQVTGLDSESRAVQQIVATFKRLKSYARFDAEEAGIPDKGTGDSTGAVTDSEEPPIGLALSHTITLNLPATTNIEVFNAIFKSLREHLIRD